MGGSRSKKLKIIHFNDLYELKDQKNKEGKIIGSASRFCTMIHSFEKKNPLVVFSGDLWSPSKLTSIFKGEQLVKTINHLGLDAAALGNHDVDLGEKQSTKLNTLCNFPWLLSNAKLIDGEPIAGCKEYHIVQKGNWKVGIISLAESEWVLSLGSIDSDDIDFEDMVLCTERLGEELKVNQGCNFIVALTHLRIKNDRLVARESSWVDIFLGGHDHIYHHEKIEDNLFIKSGWNFQSFSEIKIYPRNVLKESEKALVPTEPMHDGKGGKVEVNKTYVYLIKNKYVVHIIRRKVTGDIEPDPLIVEEAKKYYTEVNKMMKVIISKIDCGVDTSKKAVRLKENGMGNIICDIMKHHHHADIGLLNGSSIKSNRQYNKGQFAVGDWYDVLPYNTDVLKIEVTGQTVVDVLQHSLTSYPIPKGRFLQVSGVSYKYDTRKEPLERLDKSTVLIDGKPPVLDKKYTIAICSYIAEGKEDYACLEGAKQLVDEENAPRLKDIIFEFFELAQKEDTVQEQKLMNKHRQVFTGEYLKKTAKHKLKNALRKITNFNRLNSTLRGRTQALNLMKKVRKRSAKFLDSGNIKGFVTNGNGIIPNTVVCRRLKHYHLVSSNYTIMEEGKKKMIFGVKPINQQRSVNLDPNQE